jgi:Tol biopolymer transport system component
MQPALRTDELAVAYVNDATGVTRLWKMLPNGTGHSPLTSSFGTAAAVEANPFFNPAKNIAFTTTTSGTSADIYLYKPTKIESLVAEAANDVEGVVTHDAKNVIFTSDRDGDTELYLFNLVTKATTRVTNRVGVDHQPSVAPTVGAQAYRIFYVSYDPTPVLKWKTVAGAATVIPTGAGSPANPSVVVAY